MTEEEMKGLSLEQRVLVELEVVNELLIGAHKRLNTVLMLTAGGGEQDKKYWRVAAAVAGQVSCAQRNLAARAGREGS